MTRERILQILENPLSIQEEEEKDIRQILDEYPYFQSLRTHLLIYYKKNHPVRYHNELGITAAHTPDRGHLRGYLEKEWPPAPRSQEKISPEETSIPDTPPTGARKEEPEQKEISGHEAKKENASLQPDEKLSYIQWVKRLKNQNHSPSPHPSDAKQRKRLIIDRFLKQQPKIRPKKDSQTEPPAEVMESVREDQWLMTETLARLYVKQKKYDKALKAYEILMLKYPKKNRYFAARIAEIKNLLNE